MTSFIVLVCSCYVLFRVSIMQKLCTVLKNYKGTFLHVSLSSVFFFFFYVLFSSDMEADSVSIWPRMDPFLLGALQVNMLIPSIQCIDLAQ